ncbi:MAG: hypothetical protein AAFP19_24820, partial [Bacteroidota bacterium]
HCFGRTKTARNCRTDPALAGSQSDRAAPLKRGKPGEILSEQSEFISPRFLLHFYRLKNEDPSSKKASMHQIALKY